MAFKSSIDKNKDEEESEKKMRNLFFSLKDSNKIYGGKDSHLKENQVKEISHMLTWNKPWKIKAKFMQIKKFSNKPTKGGKIATCIDNKDNSFKSKSE